MANAFDIKKATEVTRKRFPAAVPADEAARSEMFGLFFFQRCGNALGQRIKQIGQQRSLTGLDQDLGLHSGLDLALAQCGPGLVGKTDAAEVIRHGDSAARVGDDIGGRQGGLVVPRPVAWNDADWQGLSDEIGAHV